MKNTFGEVLTELRCNKNMSKSELSRVSGIDRTTIVAIESGCRKMPKAETIIKLAKALEYNDISLLKLAGYLIEDKDSKTLEYELIIKGYVNVVGNSNQECLANGDRKIFEAVQSLQGKSSKFDEIATDAEMDVSVKFIEF